MHIHQPVPDLVQAAACVEDIIGEITGGKPDYYCVGDCSLILGRYLLAQLNDAGLFGASNPEIADLNLDSLERCKGCLEVLLETPDESHVAFAASPNAKLDAATIIVAIQLLIKLIDLFKNRRGK